MNSKQERLVQFIESTNLSKNKFAKYIGTSSAMISKLTTQHVDFRIDILEKIISKYPNLNLTWLLTGVGEMYVNTPTSETQEYFRGQLINHLESEGLPPSRVNAIDLQQFSKRFDEVVAAALAGKSRFRIPGASFPRKLRKEISNENPELDKVLDNLSIISDVAYLIDDINQSPIGKAVSNGYNVLTTVKSYKEFKELRLLELNELLEYKDLFTEFAKCSKNFMATMESVKDKLNLEFEFDL